MGSLESAQRRRERAAEQRDDSTTGQAIEAARPGGQPLDGAARQFLEPRFGHNFADIRVHSDAEADGLARDLDAVAFTTGADVFFRQGAYAPDSPQGLHLLAHELTHTIQQAAGPVDGTPGPDGVAVSDPSDQFEQAAEQNAASIMATHPGVRIPGDQAVETAPLAQGVAGAAAAAQRAELMPSIQREPPTATITMDPVTVTGSVFSAGAGTTGAEQIDVEISNLKTDVQSFFKAYTDGLQAFNNTMQWGSEQSAEAHLLLAFTKGVGKKLLDVALDMVAGENEALKATLGALKSGIESAYEEYERSEKAEGNVKIGDFINNALRDIQPTETKALKAVEDQRRPLKDAFGALNDTAAAPPGAAASGSPAPTPAPQSGNIVGQQGAFLREIKGIVDNFESKIPTTAQMQEQFTEGFATLNGTDWISTGGGGGFMNGRLSLHVRVYKDGDKYTVKSIDDKWKLQTDSPKAPEIAKSLKDSLAAQGGRQVWQTSLEKEIDFTIEVESGSFWTANTDETGAFHFSGDSIDSPTVSTISSGLQGFDPSMYLAAWNGAVKDRVRGIAEIEG